MDNQKNSTDLRENKMGVMPVGKLLVNMALPMIISMLVQAMYNVVDSIYVSRSPKAPLPRCPWRSRCRICRSPSPAVLPWASTLC